MSTNKKELTDMSQEELLAYAATLEAENQKIATEKKSIEENLASEISEKQKAVSTLEEALQANSSLASSASKTKTTFKVGKKYYSLKIPRFVTRFNGGAIEVTAEAVTNNPELAAYLVENNKHIKEVNP